jgi:hypothetical protein
MSIIDELMTDLWVDGSEPTAAADEAAYEHARQRLRAETATRPVLQNRRGTRVSRARRRAQRPNDRVGESALRRAWLSKISLVGRLRLGVAASAIGAAALAVVLTAVSLSGSAPSVAQAFPALNGPSALTPVALQQSLSAGQYGLSSSVLNIAKGRTVDTPWGTGYVLTGPDNRFVCVVAPGLSRADWGASCASTAMATSSGTGWAEYAYDSATDTARLVALFPKGATATMQTGGGAPRQLSLSDGLLAVDITSPTQIAVTINGHTDTHQFSPHEATPAPTSTSGSSGSTTAAAATPTSTAP